MNYGYGTCSSNSSKNQNVLRLWNMQFSWQLKLLIVIYLLTAIRLSPGGSSTVHIYTEKIDRTTQNKQYIEQHNNLGECGPCPVLASYTLAFSLQLRKSYATFDESELNMFLQSLNLYFSKIHREDLDLINLFTVPEGDIRLKISRR
jgi:hypothetical protein